MPRNMFYTLQYAIGKETVRFLDNYFDFKKIIYIKYQWAPASPPNVP
jgi:hypothetical protein